jgi:hypothetical protein
MVVFATRGTCRSGGRDEHFAKKKIELDPGRRCEICIVWESNFSGPGFHHRVQPLFFGIFFVVIFIDSVPDVDQKVVAESCQKQI